MAGPPFVRLGQLQKWETFRHNGILYRLVWTIKDFNRDSNLVYNVRYALKEEKYPDTYEFLDWNTWVERE